MNLTSSKGYQTPKMEDLPNAKIACDNYAMTLHQYVYPHEEHLFLFPGRNVSDKKNKVVFEFYDWVQKAYKKRIVPSIVVTGIPKERDERNILFDIDSEIYEKLNVENTTFLVLFHRVEGILFSTSNCPTAIFGQSE